MEQLFFGDFAPWFSVPALIGSGFFLIRTLLMFVTGFAFAVLVNLRRAEEPSSPESSG